MQGKVILPSIALGLATFIMQASESVISVCFNSSLLKYGGDIAVGAMTILTSVMQFAMLPLQGLGQGAQPIISYNYGARNPYRVKSTFRLLLKVSLSYAVVLWLCVMIFPKGFAALFTSDSELITYTETAIIVAVMRKFVLLLPLIYIMPHIFGDNKAMAVYMAEPVADFLAVSFTSVLFTVLFKKSLRQIS